MGWKDDPVVSGWQGDELIAPNGATQAAEETPWWQVQAIGAGRTLDRLAAGMRQATPEPVRNAIDWANDKLGMGPVPSIDPAVQSENTRFAKALSDRYPVSSFSGEVAPLLAAQTPLGMGVLGLTEYGTPKERAIRGAAGWGGGKLGEWFAQGVGRIINPVRSVPSESLEKAKDAASRLNVELRPSEIARSRPLGWAEAALNDLPISGGMAQGKEIARRQAINSAANRSIGQLGDEVTETTLAAARDKIGATFDSLLNGRKIPLDDKFRAEVQAITGSKVMKSLRDEGVEAVIAPFRDMPQGTVKASGEWFQQNKTALDSLIRSAYTKGENGKARALEQFEKALERAAIRSMEPAERQAFMEAQRQWASLRMLETGKVVEGGNVMPGRLDSALGTRYKQAYKEGKLQGELADIGRLGQVFKPLPQSGTAPRAVYSGIASGAWLTSPYITAAMFAAPPAIQAAMQSPAGRRYLTEGITKITPELERRLIRGGGLLGIPALQLAP